ncbi:hypothetical protein DAT35_20820 [Vitiosangium sp. GDMCC 1.1324]|nr:hypothetical protein DAT35_20820 [Vitiosangium sp. GDMCC 1.1324]
MRFLTGWFTPGSPVHDIGLLWLEFDLPGSATPSVFFSINQGSSLERQVDEAFLLFHGERLSKAVHTRIQRCVDTLPPGGSLNHVAAMLGRNRDVRLALELKPLQLPQYLHALGWPYPLEELTRSFNARAPDVDRLGLSLDVEPGGALGPRLGLEFAFHRALGNEPRWPRLLAEWGEDGLCSPEQCDALLRWPGRAPFGPALQLLRTLHHVKVLWEGGRLSELKAYPALRLQPGFAGGAGS